MMRKMMLRNYPSHLLGHQRALSDPCLEEESSSPAWDSTKCISRRVLSQINLIAPLTRHKDNRHSIRKWRCSRKNGFVVAGVELNKVAGHDKGVDPFNRESTEDDKKQSFHMSCELLDRSLSVSGNAMVAENYSSLQVGPKGVLLICTEKGCSPAHPSQTEDATDGKDSNIIGGTRRSCGADSDDTDVYYQKMLESNPGNSLLLTNYAKFLHEVQHDVEKAEIYYKRALMASPGDGEILSMYAKFIWEIHNDVAQTEVYFRRAVEVASEDCYVVASYAHFLWNSRDENEEEEENEPSLTRLTSSTSGTTAA